MDHDQNESPDQSQNEQDILVCGPNAQRGGGEDDRDKDVDEDVDEDGVDHGVLGVGDRGEGKDEMGGMKMTMGG